MFYLILGIIALIYLCCFSTWEHMTNSDVQKKQEHHKTATTWDSVHKSKTESKSKSKEEETQIRGPQITAKEAHEQSIEYLPIRGNPLSDRHLPL
jgi:FtsZ-interacting cell division protein ZipA